MLLEVEEVAVNPVGALGAVYRVVDVESSDVPPVFVAVMVIVYDILDTNPPIADPEVKLACVIVGPLVGIAFAV
jgi:hypothetical protein